MLKLVLFVTSGVAGVAFLAWVMFYGSTRRRRMAEFVRERNGSWSLYDDFDLQPVVDDLFGREEWWVGVSGRMEGADSVGRSGDVYLLDLHPEPSGTPRRTGLIMDLEASGSDDRYVVRERFPDGSSDPTGAGRFHVTEGADSEALRSRLAELPENRDWLLEVRFARTAIAVSSRERPLADREEWSGLVDVARTLARAGDSAH